MWIIDSDQAVNISDFDWIGLDHTTNCTIGARLG